MDLEYCAAMEARLGDLLRAISAHLRPDEIRGIQEWLDHNELGMALEDMVAACRSVPIVLTTTQLTEFDDIATIMGLNEPVIEPRSVDGGAVNPHVEALLAATPWDELRTSHGFAVEVPRAVVSLAQSISETDADAAYWQLDNVVVVQGAVLQSALPLIPILLLLLDGSLADVARSRVLDLLFELQGSEAHPAELLRENLKLAEDCTVAVRRGLDRYVASTRSRDSRTRRTAVDLVGALEKDPVVRSRVLHNGATDPDVIVRKSANWWLSHSPLDE